MSCKARREAMAADLVVVNHHLFFADMALRDSGVAELLPSVEVAIFDEAHQLGEAGVQFLGTILGSAQLIDFARDMLAVGLQQARGLAPWPELPRPATGARATCAWPPSAGCGEVRAGAEAALGRAQRRRGLRRRRCEQVGEACEAARAALDDGERAGARFRPTRRARGAASAALARRVRAAARGGKVRWIDLSPQQARLVESPLDIREAMKRADAGRAQGLDLHLGDARRRRQR